MKIFTEGNSREGTAPGEDVVDEHRLEGVLDVDRVLG